MTTSIINILGFAYGPTEITLMSVLAPVLLCTLPFIFYLVTLQNILKEIRPENRFMPPANVWLSFIPLFGLAWQFVIVNKVSKSVSNELANKNVDLKSIKTGNGIGIAYSILFCGSIIPVAGSFSIIAGLICWIIYWVKISNCKLLLETSILDENIIKTNIQEQK